MLGRPALVRVGTIVVAIQVGLFGCGHGSARPVVESHCPNLIADTLTHETPEGLTRRGAADGLPPDGATTRDRVTAAVRLSQKDLARQYSGVLAVTVGPGLGWTFSESTDSTPAYHRVADYQVVVHLEVVADCPKFDAFVSNDKGQRVPVLFVYGAA